MTKKDIMYELEKRDDMIAIEVGVVSEYVEAGNSEMALFTLNQILKMLED